MSAPQGLIPDMEGFAGGGSLLVDTPEVDVNPGETVSVPLAFEGAPRAALWLLLDTVDGVTARFGDVELETGDFFGSGILGGELIDPVDGPLEVTNNGSERVIGGVIVILDSPRYLTMDIEPVLVRLGDTVTVTVRLTEPSDSDLPTVSVSDPQGATIESLTLDVAAEGEWVSTFISEVPGTYSLTASVEGPRPRFDTAFVEVADDAPDSDP